MSSKLLRKPDFVTSGTTHEFWIFPEMKWRHNISRFNTYEYSIKEKDGKLMCWNNGAWEAFWSEIQVAYKEYKVKIDNELDKILLGDESESRRNSSEEAEILRDQSTNRLTQ